MLACIVVGVAGTAPRAARLTTPRELAWAPVLNLRLTVSNELPGLSRQALIKETESIWREGHLQLRWLEGSEVPEPGMNLRVLVTPRTVTSTIEGHRWAVGELIRFDGSRAIALASIIGARRIVEETRPLGLTDLLEFQHHTLGVVLGRAVAHEIGHYVLRTNTHASYGLMRANIDAREFADLRTGTFRIDREAQAHLAARAALGPASGGGEFSYSSAQ
jgi:hypothetical protein